MLGFEGIGKVVKHLLVDAVTAIMPKRVQELIDKQDELLFDTSEEFYGVPLEPMKDPSKYPGLDGMEVVELGESEGGLKLKTWYKPPEPGKPVILYIPGNRGHLGDVGATPPELPINVPRAFRTEIIADVIADGSGCIAITHPGYGINKDVADPSEETLVDGVWAAVTYLKEQGIEAHDIIIYSVSLGSSVAFPTAARMEKDWAPASGLYASASFSSTEAKALDIMGILSGGKSPLDPKKAEGVSMSSWWGHAILDMVIRHPFNNEALLRDGTLKSTPVHLNHGAYDIVTGYEHSIRLEEARIEGGGIEGSLTIHDDREFVGISDEILRLGLNDDLTDHPIEPFDFLDTKKLKEQLEAAGQENREYLGRMMFSEKGHVNIPHRKIVSGAKEAWAEQRAEREALNKSGREYISEGSSRQSGEWRSQVCTDTNENGQSQAR